MSFDYHRITIPNVTDDRSLRHERFLPKLSSAEPTDYKDASNNVESKNVDLPLTDDYNISPRFTSCHFSPRSANGEELLESYS